MNLHVSLHPDLHMYLLCVYKCVFTADKNGKLRDGSSPAPAAPSVPRVRLNMNHLVFHKVLGKGSFGKVGARSPSLSPLPNLNEMIG